MATAPEFPCAGIILCGGQSSRMGMCKALLPFGAETMLGRMVRLLGQAAQPIVVVAAPQQELPPLPEGVIVARDRLTDVGPLEGLAAGFEALAGKAELAYVTSVDMPLLAPGLVRELVSLAAGYDAVTPVWHGIHHPLSAVYRLTLRPTVGCLLAQDRHGPMALFDVANTLRVDAESLRAVDPQLDSLRNLNRPADYLAALAACGFTCPPETLAMLKPRGQCS